MGKFWKAILTIGILLPSVSLASTKEDYFYGLYDSMVLNANDDELSEKEVLRIVNQFCTALPPTIVLYDNPSQQHTAEITFSNKIHDWAFQTTTPGLYPIASFVAKPTKKMVEKGFQVLVGTFYVTFDKDKQKFISFGNTQPDHPENKHNDGYMWLASFEVDYDFKIPTEGYRFIVFPETKYLASTPEKLLNCPATKELDFSS